MTRVVNISKKRVFELPSDAPLISISDAYSVGVAIPNEKNRPLLKLEFFPRDHAPEISEDRCMTQERAEKIFAFVEEQVAAGAEVIYVQCTEGRVRSFTICATVGQLEGVTHDHASSCIKSGILDRYTCNILGDELDKRLRTE